MLGTWSSGHQDSTITLIGSFQTVRNYLNGKENQCVRRKERKECRGTFAAGHEAFCKQGGSCCFLVQKKSLSDERNSKRHPKIKGQISYFRKIMANNCHKRIREIYWNTFPKPIIANIANNILMDTFICISSDLQFYIYWATLCMLFTKLTLFLQKNTLIFIGKRYHREFLCSLQLISH